MCMNVNYDWFPQRASAAALHAEKTITSDNRRAIQEVLDQASAQQAEKIRTATGEHSKEHPRPKDPVFIG